MDRLLDRLVSGLPANAALLVTADHGQINIPYERRFDIGGHADLQDGVEAVAGFRPASVARTPGYVLREDADRFLMLFGWALGEYMWTVVADAAEALGGGPVGVDALDREVARA